MSDGLSLIVAGGDGMAGEGSDDKDNKSVDAGTTDWGTEETTEPEESM